MERAGDRVREDELVWPEDTMSPIDVVRNEPARLSAGVAMRKGVTTGAR
jgi:hypothetical protein